MKKIIAVLCSILLICAIAVPALAQDYTTEDILAIVAEKTQGTDKYVKIATDYLNAHDYTQDEINSIMSDALEIKEVWDEAGTTVPYAQLPSDIKERVKSVAVEKANEHDVVLTISDKSVTVIDENGKNYTVARSSGSSLVDDNSPIKQTGADYTSAVIIASVLMVAVAAVFVFSRKAGSAE